MKKMSQIESGALDNPGINDYDHIAEIYDEVMGVDISKIIFPAYCKIIQKTFPSSEKLRYLDMACGTGSFLRIFKKKFGKRAECFGIDLSKEQIKSAKRIAGKAKLEITFRVGNVLTAAFPKNLDVITMNLDAMNHLRRPKDWKILLTKAAKHLKPGGIFLFDINTQERLRNDLNSPEVIIKKNLTYVQVGVKLSRIGSFVLQQHIMQIFKKEGNQIKEYNAHIQQIAPSKKELFSMLKKAGFDKIREIPYSENLRSKHIFLKNRLFVLAQRN